jgi:putative transposase
MRTLSHKIELKVNNKQATYFAKACGVARVAYNWALSEWSRMYEAGEKPNEGILRKKLNSIKKEQFPWMLEVTKCAPQLAIKDDLTSAFTRFFNKQGGYPKYRRKDVRERFHISNDQFDVKEDSIRIPRLGWVHMRESLLFKGKVLSATISKTADKWFASITVEVEDINISYKGNCKNILIAGVDLGINTFATVSSDGIATKYSGVKPHKAKLNRLKRLNKSLSRKIKKSSNRKKARYKLARLHAKVANIRNDYIEKTSTELSNKYNHVVIENLNVSGMSKNKKISRSILEMGFYNFRNRLQTKLNARGKRLTIADRWYASSKLCSNCSYLYNEMTLKDRMWVCPNCSTNHDRDINAAINLEKLAVSSTVSACGVVANGGMLSNQRSTSYAMLKQEFNNSVAQDCSILGNIV